MHKIPLTDDVFWKWMENENLDKDSGIPGYLKFITDTLYGEHYDLESLGTDSFREDSSMENLSLSVPREYFLEIQYCAKIYATMLGKVFPQLASHIDQLAYIEWLLYTEPGWQFYRDHMVHMFKVAFICDNLLSFSPLLDKVIEYQFNSGHFMNWCTDQSIQTGGWPTEDRREVVRLGLFWAALFHDIGYGHFFLTKYKKRLFNLYQWLMPRADPTDVDAAATKSLLQSLPSQFVRKYHDSKHSQKIAHHAIAGFFHDCLPLNHSIASMFFVLDVAEKLRTSRALPEKLHVAFQLAAEACMIHDMTDDDNWLYLTKTSNGHFINHENCKEVPLALLLIFSDELAVWNRPRLIVNPKGRHGVYYKFDTDGRNDKIMVSVDETKNLIKIKVSPDRTKQIIRSKFEEKLPCFRSTPVSQKGAVSKLFDYKIEIVP